MLTEVGNNRVKHVKIYIAILLLSFGMFGPVEASPRQRTNYAIEAGLAIHQLSELAREAKATILFDYELIKTVTVNPVIGNYNLKQALQLMLKGTPSILSLIHICDPTRPY